MAMRGWRRIGIIVSVIWFFGFGVFLWNRFVEDAVAPYAQDHRSVQRLNNTATTSGRRMLATRRS